MPPFRFFIHGVIRKVAKRADRFAVNTDRCSGNSGAVRLIHEGHKLVWESRHRAANANSTHVRTSANSRHPTPLRHIAIDHRTPTAQFHDAFKRTVLCREIALLVVARPVAAFVHGLAE